MTKVTFLIHKEEDGQADVFAYFPKEHYHHEGHPNYGVMRTCYAHIGQHSACHVAYANECEEATKEQYADLLAELKGQGYDDLVILNKDK